MQPVKKRIHSCYNKSKEQVHEKHAELVCIPMRVKAYSLQSHVWVRVMGSVRSHLEGKLFDAAR